MTVETTFNEKFLRGELDQWVSASVGQWVSSMIGKRSNESLMTVPRLHPETNENQHTRLAQHMGTPRRGAPGRRRQKIHKNPARGLTLPLRGEFIINAGGKQ